MEPSTKDTSGVSYADWVRDLRVKDVECCHTPTNALQWLSLLEHQEVDVVRIQEYLRGKYNMKKNAYRFKIRRCSDLLYGFYSPIPIQNVWICYRQDPPNRVDIETEICLKDAGKGRYLFEVPLPLCAMMFGQISCEYNLEREHKYLPGVVPVTLITGYLRVEIRREVGRLFNSQNVLISRETAETPNLYLKGITSTFKMGVLLPKDLENKTDSELTKKEKELLVIAREGKNMEPEWEGTYWVLSFGQ